MTVRFAVENAGCASCAELVRDALGRFGEVTAVDVDESADVANVHLACSSEVAVADIDRALADASTGSGHAYRVRAGSWIAAA